MQKPFDLSKYQKSIDDYYASEEKLRKSQSDSALNSQGVRYSLGVPVTRTEAMSTLYHACRSAAHDF